MALNKNERDRMLQAILYHWDGYDNELSDRENLVELIIQMGYLDDVQMLLERYRRKGKR
jgi:aryl carrier-like protein